MSTVFACHHSIAVKQLKGEDIAFVEEAFVVGQGRWSLYCVCDGHGGTAAATFIRGNLPRLLKECLPSSGAPAQICGKEGRAWAGHVAEILASVFCKLDESFAQTAAASGTTVTLALICGTLLTVVNVGDSEAFLDTSSSILPMTEAHKVQTNAAEQTRLKEKRATLAPFIGGNGGGGSRPLRVWPGGIAISRSIGDFDCSQHVICNPHITQAILPVKGSRLVLATDGLWDHLGGRRACRLARRCLLSRAPTRLFRTLMTETSNCLFDDTTILVVDILPEDAAYADFSLLRRNADANKTMWKSLKKIFKKLPTKKRASHGICASIDTSVSFPLITSRGHILYREAATSMIPDTARESERRRISIYHEATHKWNSEEAFELFPQAESNTIDAQNP